MPVSLVMQAGMEPTAEYTQEATKFRKADREVVRRATELVVVRLIMDKDGILRDIMRGMRRLLALNCPYHGLEVMQVRRINEIHDEVLRVRRDLHRIRRWRHE